SLMSKGGRFIIVLPSTTRDGRKSRIVPCITEGGAVTVPRTLADIVVTEFGIAHLRGKTLKQRMEELVKIAHPHFRSDLRKAFTRFY
ncbi:MAG: acetyl-CoA hydrolase/transferase C-terminal domain-containing protein, partial [candidate division WOR-3 bacterium]